MLFVSSETNMRSLVVALIFICAYPAKCVEFNRSYLGVVFSPYVKNAEGGNPIPELSSYTIEDLRTTLEVIATKFSYVLTLTVDATWVEQIAPDSSLMMNCDDHWRQNAPYRENHSYYKDTNIIARTAEVAALINEERNETILSVVVGIFLRNDEEQRTNTEAHVALDAIKIANSIHPGTVTKILMFNIGLTSIESDKLTPKWIAYFRNIFSSFGLNIQIGFLPMCSHLVSILNTKSGLSWKTWKNVTLEADFIICLLGHYKNVSSKGAKFTFHKMIPELLYYRKSLKDTNRDIEVISLTSWPSGGGGNWYNKSSLKEYWMEANKFAGQNEYLTFLPAFDNPNLGKLIKRMGHIGWWRLTRNDLNQNIKGFVEKFSEPPARTNRPLDSAAGSLNNDDNTSNWFYGGTTGVALVMLILVATFLIVYRKRQYFLRVLLSEEELEEFFNGSSTDPGKSSSSNYFIRSLSPLVLPYDRIFEIPKENLTIFKSKILGVGQFGCVYKAQIRDSTGAIEVALKTTKRECPPTALKGLLSEIKILSYLGNHPNIISICGAYTAELQRGIVYVATEICALGSLKDHLMSLQITEENPDCQNEGKDISLQRNMYLWSYEIACGMEYVSEKGVIHADLAARNVLLSSDGIAKITDFGLSRRLYDYEKYVKETREALPWRWMAIESLKCMEFSTKSDVWSYAVTLWEIFSLGDNPYPVCSWSDDFIKNLEDGTRMNKPIYASSEMFQLLMDCWKSKPEDRPSFTDLKMTTKQFSDQANYHDLANE